MPPSEPFISLLGPSDINMIWTIQEKQPGWLNCSVSNKPEFIIKRYRVTPNMEKLSDDLIHGHNTLSILFAGVSRDDEGKCRLTTDLAL